LNNHTADDYIQSKFVKRKTQDGVTSKDALALFKCAISTYASIYNAVSNDYAILQSKVLIRKVQFIFTTMLYFAQLGCVL